MQEKSQVSTCIVCQESFMPHPKVGLRQKACRKPTCQLERKRRNQQAWLAKEPDYFKGRYPQLKEQILNHRKKVKAAQKQSGQNSPGCIQDELTINNNNLLGLFEKTLSIQDELKFVITIIKRQIPFILKPVYKSS